MYKREILFRNIWIWSLYSNFEKTRNFYEMFRNWDFMYVSILQMRINLIYFIHE